jgi:DNA end-binding protein Ku
MAPRAVSTASISFGLVNIPVKLYSSGNSKASISFNLLSKKGHKLKQQYIDPKDGDRVVERSEMVKGYEYAKDQYVIFTEEELKEMQEKSTQSIDITEFVPAEEVPQVYLQKTYWLGPDKGGERAYRLLGEAMKTCGRNAIAKYAARGKTYLVMLAPHDHGIAMHQLYFSDEVVPFSEIPLDDSIQLKDGEIALAMQLINQIATDVFKPDNYEDEVKKRIEAAIQQKIDGEAVTIAPSEAPKAQIIDLMDALKASLGGLGDAPKAAPKAAVVDDDEEEEEEAKPAKKAKKAPAKKKKASS